MNAGKVFLGTLAGLCAGALLGVLFAPDKGSVIRQNISKKSQDYVDDVKRKIDELVDGISERLHMGKDGSAKGRNKIKTEVIV
jgi:gas vesicle protein